MKRVLVPLATVATLAGCPPSDPPSSVAPDRVDDILALTGDETTGEAVYAARCQSCHAADGSGGIGPSLLDEIPGEDAAEVLTVVIEGEGTMPAAADLADQDLADLWAYLDSAFAG